MTDRWLNPTRPPFALSDTQRATLDALAHTAAGDDARTTLLRQWHQAYCWQHRQIVGVFGSLDPAMFTKRWNAEFADLAEARAAEVVVRRRAA